MGSVKGSGLLTGWVTDSFTEAFITKSMDQNLSEELTFG
jgi:hypothetical protein